MSYKECFLVVVWELNKVKEVLVFDFSELVYICCMSGVECDSYEVVLGEYWDKQGKVDVLGYGNKIMVWLLLVGFGDENGECVFDDDDVDMVCKIFSWVVMDYFFGEVLRFNCFNDNVVKDVVKN